MGGIGLLVVFILYLVLEPAGRTWLTFRGGPMFFLVLVLTATLVAARSTERPAEKRFWFIFSGAVALWLAVIAFIFQAERARTPVLDLIGDVGYAGYYVLLIFAIETRPHRHRASPTERLEVALLAPAAAFFVFGWLVYLTLVKVASGLGNTETLLPSVLLFCVLDAAIGIRLFQLTARATATWRTTYLLLGLSMVGFLATDLFQVLHAVLPGFEWSWGRSLNVVWNVPSLIVVFAARFFASKATSAVPVNLETQTPIVRPLPTVLWALSFPLVHGLFYGSGLTPEWLAPEGEQWRETVVLVMLVVLGGYALLQRHLLVRQSLELWRERRRIEDALKTSEQDLRLMLERQHRNAEVERLERTFAKAFEASPDGLAISTFDEGRLLDVNDAFARLLGAPPSELKGRLASSLGIWPDGTSRQRMINVIKRHGSLRDREVVLQGLDGQRRRLALSIETLDIDEERLLLAVLRQLEDTSTSPDPTSSQIVRARLEPLIDALSGAGTGVVAFDRSGALLFRNDLAQQLSERPMGPELDSRLASSFRSEADSRLETWELTGTAGRLVVTREAS